MHLEAFQPEPSPEAFRLSPQQRTRWRQIEAHRHLPWGLRCRVAVAAPATAEGVVAALDRLVARYEVLRTTFPAVPGMKLPAQEIAPPAPVGAPVVDVRGLAAPELRRCLDRLAAALAEPFGDREPPLRAALARRDDDHLLLLALSPLVADRRGLDLLLAELEVELGGRPAESGDGPLQYADLAEWQNEMLETAELEAGRLFWRGRQAAADSPLAVRWPGARFLPRRLVVETPRELSPALAAAAEALAAAPGEVLLAGWLALLARAEGGGPPAIALLGDGRRYDELADALGPFERRLPLVLEGAAEAEGCFADLVARVAEARRQAWAAEELFEPAAEAPSPAYGFRWHAAAAPPAGRLAVAARDELVDRVGVDLEAAAAAGSLDLGLRYDAAAFDGRDVAALGRQLVALLTAAVADPSRPVAALPLADAAERRRLLAVARGPAVAVAARTLPERVDEQARSTPGRVAVVADRGETTYGELSAAARRLAARLVAGGVRPGEVVALAAERSPELVVALLAVMRAGAAAAVLDPANPAGRLEAMLADCGGPLLLAGDEAAARLAAYPRLAHLAGEIAAAAAEPAPAAVPPVDPAAAAYVIFTSGSTGRPKGVLVSHAALVNRLAWSQRRFPLAAGDRVGQLAAIGFDFALYELLAPLAAGAALVLPRPVAAQEPEYLARFLAERAVTVAHFVPSLLRLLLDEPGLAAATALARVYVGGEAISADLADRFFAALPGVDLVNQYGPTEATIDATAWRCRRGDRRRRVPIGRPIDNTRAYVMAAGAVEPAGFGAAGELCLAGDGLAFGYLGRPGETALRFRPDPFGPPGSRLYRTGDLARVRARGVIDFLGRLDHQVQVRGTRVELGEIADALAAHPEVREAAVRVDDEQRLVAYLATAGGRAVEHRDVVDHLRRRLP
ncbi:MAG TPA: amino acid adenylation domain-containing protein, partial [Thermoanaerobaculia bacterium]